ncbi:MAG: putative entry exclusion protein TrbK-alt [Caulobacteraceae bacterium]
MRGRFFHWPAIGRAGAMVLAVLIVALAAVFVLREVAKAPVSRVEAPATADPLAPALARCQTLGTKAENDPACLAAWAQNRRRFFTYRLSPALPANAR